MNTNTYQKSTSANLRCNGGIASLLSTPDCLSVESLLTDIITPTSLGRNGSASRKREKRYKVNSALCKRKRNRTNSSSPKASKPRLGYRVIRGPKAPCRLTLDDSKACVNEYSSIRSSQYAKRTASLRRAESLTSEIHEDETYSTGISSCVTTAPATPHIEAKIRLRNYIEREKRGRVRDGFLDAPDEVEGNNNTTHKFLNVIKGARGWEEVLDIGQGLRKEIIIWFLEVLPKPLASDSEISRSMESIQSRDNLCDQLTTSPETRFHAAWMFLRYFFIINSMDRFHGNNEQVSVTSCESRSDGGKRLAVWDVALACLALSIKEVQRDLLSSFSYYIGDGLQLILDELWIALPSLRLLLSCKGGWENVQRETYRGLYLAICQPDVLRFPISLLTAAILMKAILTSLSVENEHAQEEEIDSEIEGIFQDIQAVMGYPLSFIIELDFQECRMWFATIY
ncbi:hypothetical protein BDQ17DRAFT_1345462 [Cyathus striatus]|nr:hypothetical protein BDQ17DRAFT_1345462 [Cyathus striatus]